MTENPCTLQPEQLTERIEEWRRLAPAIVGMEPTATGASRLELKLDVRAPEELQEWVAKTFGADVPRPIEPEDAEAVREAVRRHYAAVAEGGSCCSSMAPCGSEGGAGGIGASGYPDPDLDGLPGPAVAASAGCANPVAMAEPAPGETVLDLGSGGGIDVLLSARRVGPTGKVYGLDMTDEMLALAEGNMAEAGADNVELLKGRIEAVPLPSATVDVVVSNCVIALSPDKAAVFAEAHRVLKAGGRLAIADVVADVDRPPDDADDVSEWVACSAGALTREQYRAGLSAAGFGAVSITDSHQVGDGFASVIVSAVKMP